MSALTDTFTSIANAIRTKLGVQTTYTPAQMSTAIASIPTQKEEQTKSVTATTSQQTVTPDTGKVLSLVTVNPQVHSATYTPTGYSNANDMGAQNNYRYVDTSAYEPTSITPSNSSPVTITSGTIYKASGNGKAVETVQTITPTYGIEDTVQSGAIIRFGDSGVITKEIPTPLDLTPSNSSPATITSGGLYSATAGGKAVSTITDRTPSDSSPAQIYASSIVKPSEAGYLYKSQHVSQVVASVTGSCAGSTTYTKYNIGATDSIFFDTNYFTASNGTLTVKRAFSGYLYLYAFAGRNSSGTTIYAYIQVRKNGTSYASVNGTSSSSNKSTNTTISLAVGDTIDLYTRVSSGSSNAVTRFTVGIKTVSN